MPNTSPDFPAYVRISQIVKPYGILPISKSTWWAGVASGRYPKPVKLGPGITVWPTRLIYELAENGVAAPADAAPASANPRPDRAHGSGHRS